MTTITATVVETPITVTATPHGGSAVTATITMSAVSVVVGGNVAGPSGAVDGNLAAFDGVTGKILEDSGIISTPLTNIVDADGTLADITTKYNTLLAQLIAAGYMAGP